MGAEAASSDWVLLPLEAERGGFRNPRAFRRWCQSHSVPIRKDGRREWVRHCDVQAAIESLGLSGPPKPENDAADRVRSKIMGAN